MDKTPVGQFGWFDLTISNAAEVRDFYKSVVGWSSSEVEMNDYQDYNMIPPNQEAPVAGVCHKKAGNKDFPGQWIMYVIVESLESSLKACEENGGSVAVPQKEMPGYGIYAVIKDPAGAYLGLFQYI